MQPGFQSRTISYFSSVNPCSVKLELFQCTHVASASPSQSLHCLTLTHSIKLHCSTILQNSHFHPLTLKLKAVADFLPICPHATNRYFMPRIWKIWVSNWDINTMQLIRTQNNRKLSISNLPRTFDYGQNSNNWKLWFLVGSLNLPGIFERLEDGARLIVMANKGTRNISPWANSHPCWLCVN